MKKTQRVFMFAVLSGAAIPAIAQPPKAVPQELSSRDLQRVQAATRKLVPVTLVTITQDFTGNFDTMAMQFDQFSKEVRSQNINVGTNAVTPLFILREDPTNKREFRFAIGIQVPKQAEVKSPLRIEQFRDPMAVRVGHTGAFQQLKGVHDTVDENIKNPPKGLAVGRGHATKFPVVVRVLNDPRKVPANQVQTEMIVPVE